MVVDEEPNAYVRHFGWYCITRSPAEDSVASFRLGRRAGTKPSVTVRNKLKNLKVYMSSKRAPLSVLRLWPFTEQGCLIAGFV